MVPHGSPWKMGSQSAGLPFFGPGGCHPCPRKSKRLIPANNVSVEVHGGGDAYLRAERTLTADVHGGGDVHYWGHPQVNSSRHGGGSVESGE